VSMKMLWRQCCALLGLTVLLIGAASAQRGGDDDGEYQILQARYGTADRNVDVTQRLKELARQDRRFRLGNELFNVDPAPREKKTLRIYARGRDGQTRTFEYEEYGYVDGAQFTGWGGGNWGQGGWNGGWGDGPGHRPGGPGGGRDDDGEYQILQARYGTADRNVDVTQRLKELARQDRRFRLGNDLFNVDPAPRQKKTLRIYARGRDGQTRTFEYEEYGYVDGAQFTGWGGGNWGQGGWNGGWDGAQANGPGRRLTLISASYGTGKRQRDITARLRGYVQNNRLDLTVENEIAGFDPAPGDRKTLWLSYSVGGGKTQQIRVNERDRLSIP